LRIETDRRVNVVRVPNAALRWRPATAADASRPVVEAGGRTAQNGRALADLREALKGEIEPGPDQAKEIEAAFADARKAFTALAGEDQNSRREQARIARKQLETRIAAALDSEQRSKFASIVARLATGQATQTARLFAVGRDGKPQGLSVRIGASDGGLIEIVSGLEAGREVIVGVARADGAGTPRAPRFGF
jgi:HlyD family secretion protein